MSGYFPEDHDCHTPNNTSQPPEVQYADGLDTDLDFLGFDRVGRYDSTRGNGRVKGATLGECL